MRIRPLGSAIAAFVVVAGLAAAGPAAPRPAANAKSENAAPAKPVRHVMQRVSQTPTEMYLAGADNLRGEAHSAARIWKEMLLFAIRRDLARPTIHARNLYHTSAMLYDVWAAYDDIADQVVHHEKLTADDIADARRIASAYAVYRLMQHRFQFSMGIFEIFPEMDSLMIAMGLDPFFFGVDGDSPAAFGNRIAQSYIAYGFEDGSNEQNGYANQVYTPVNPPLLMDEPGNPDMVDINRWQPLALATFVDQNGNPLPGGYPPFLSPEWGEVAGFAVREHDLVVRHRDGHDWKIWHDPGAPPWMDDPNDLFRWGFEMVATWGSHLDPDDGVMWDISPNVIGNTVPLPPLGGEKTFYDRLTGASGNQGYTLNPVTGEPYTEQWVPRGDYTRILAEFWADGPDSETPPGHWYSIVHYIMDHPQFERRWMGVGPELDQHEYDVKMYLTLGGGMQDAAIAAWSVKGYYDYVRPVSVIRYLAELGQATDPNLPSYHPDGFNLIPGYIELVTAETTAPGERHEHLAGEEGEIAIFSWRGPDYIDDPHVDVAGVGWILAKNWWPYQSPNFVTPPFAGYVSGHSTYSRTAAELLTLVTGSPFFPGGMGEFLAPQNDYLEFEQGPSMDIYLQWATYRDASDQTSLSRIWGGIHPPADDLPGRYMGMKIGPDVVHEARRYFMGLKSCPADYNSDGVINFEDFSAYIQAFVAGDLIADLAPPYRSLDFFDLAAFIQAWSAGCP